MARGTTTTRACLMALTVGMLVLQLLVKGAHSASAHPPVTHAGGPVAACDDTELPRSASHHYLPRDRYRAEEYVPDGTVRGAVCPWQVQAGDPGVAPTTGAGERSPHRQPRRAADSLPVILQVFRC
ncbi:hypothetical protein [Streptomyces sp. NPDC056949]|uniref:hypothetical protein n=1 Tax=Streptomyces sp. NPDC056949 TaxID=3345976 RepID=UPI00363F9C76